jgi:hypothetical protein
MRLFGKEILARKHETKELYDFAAYGLLREHNYIGTADLDLQAISGDDDITDRYLTNVKKNNKIAKAGIPKSPKEVYELESLNDATYIICCDPTYIEKHIKSLLKKRDLLPKNESHKTGWGVTFSTGGAIHGREEVESMVERLKNRYKYKEHKEFFEQYAYTTSALINDVLKAHTNLRAKRVEDFIPDLPDEAVEVMETYTSVVKELCGKKPVYYIIGDKEDFGEMDKKRDPILLVQSPFSLAWQILGAWDDTMVYLGDL